MLDENDKPAIHPHYLQASGEVDETHTVALT